MAKVFIEESTLSAIGDAIREKEGTAELIPVNDMKARILAIQSGGAELPEEAFNITGDCSYIFSKGAWDWFVELYGNQITTKDITNTNHMFESSKLTKIPFVLNVSERSVLDSSFTSMSFLTESPKIRGPVLTGDTIGNYFHFQDLVDYCYRVRDFEELLEPSMLDNIAAHKASSASYIVRATRFKFCYSLRAVPSWWYKFKLNPAYTIFPVATNSIYNGMFSYCHALDEVLNVPVWTASKEMTSNMFSSCLGGCSRLKKFTFETGEDGQAIVAKWKTQTIDLTPNNIGYIAATDNILNYNSGITADKEVTDDASYQALKNDPDWYTTKLAYSRYNHDSAVETLNSLPDTSAYLASAGGTNTIKFKGTAGSATDGGAINTLTAEEIAVAAAKGWTVTIS